MQEKIEELLQLGREAVSLSDKCKKGEPSLSITWQKNGLISGDFYSFCLELGDGNKHHKFSAHDKETLEKALNNLIKIAKREIVALGRVGNHPLTCG